VSCIPRHRTAATGTLHRSTPFAASDSIRASLTPSAAAKWKWGCFRDPRHNQTVPELCSCSTAASIGEGGARGSGRVGACGARAAATNTGANSAAGNIAVLELCARAVSRGVVAGSKVFLCCSSAWPPLRSSRRGKPLFTQVLKSVARMFFCHSSHSHVYTGSCAGMCFPDECRAAAEAILCCILAAAEKQCFALENSGKQVVARSSSSATSEASDGDLRFIRNAGDDPEFEFWGYSVTISVLNEETHKLERRMLPHLWGRQVSVAFGWIYRGQFNNGKLHGLGGVVWRRLELINSELRYVCETYIGNWKDGRREGLGVFTRSDGSSEQGMWRCNDLIEEFCIEMQELIGFQAAVNQGEAAAKKAQAHVRTDASNTAAYRADTKLMQSDKRPEEEEQVSIDQFDAYSDEYIAKLIHLLIENSQARDAAQLAINRDYEAECRREEDARQREVAAFAAHQAAIAGDSDSGDDGPAFSSMSTAFFAGRANVEHCACDGADNVMCMMLKLLKLLMCVYCAGRRYFGDSPVNVGIEFDRNSRPSIVKEVIEPCNCDCLRCSLIRVIIQFSPNFNGQPHGFGCLWQQIGTKNDRETSFYQGEFKYGLAHGWGEKRSSAGIYRGQWEKDKRHGFGEWVFPDGSVSVSFWHFDSVVKAAFIPPLLRRELENAIHKAQVSAVAAGCQEDFDVHPDEVLECRRVRESRVTEAKRNCAVELALTTHKV
jgi:hypothetical protein